jgi:predicted dehydrogenase
MAEGKLKTAVVGLDERDQSLIESLLRLGDVFEVSAVADAEGETAQVTGKKHAIDWFDDLRRMLIQKELDVIVSAGPLHNSIECLQAAMRKGTHILRCPPAARSYSEAVGLLKTAQESGVFFAVARPWRQRKSVHMMRSFLEKNAEEQFYLVEAWCSVPQLSDTHDWRKDPQLAGGGVVLNLSYPLIDQITSLFSVPQQVYALCTNQAPDRKQRQALTEDTAIVSMRFDDRMIGKIVASRTMWSGGWLMRVYGKNSQLLLNEKGFIARNGKGEVLEEVRRSDSEEVLTDKMLREFAAALLSENRDALENEPRGILNNMALIQAAYLSDKTGMPEEPARIIRIA